MEETKLCPFCGEEDVSVNYIESCVVCNNCGARGPKGHPYTNAGDDTRYVLAFSAWNKRYDMDNKWLHHH